MIWLLLLGLTDSLEGVGYTWQGFAYNGSSFCSRVHIQATSRPLLILWQESTNSEGWLTVSQVRVERWDVPKVYTICSSTSQQPGTKVRLILSGITAQSAKVILYEGYPWGELPPIPEINLQKGSPCILKLAFQSGGAYVLRAFNRFGEEIFTIPIDLSTPQELSYALPEGLRGTLLIQLYMAGQNTLLTEKTFRL